MTNVPEERLSEEIQSAIKIDGDAVRGHLDELVRSTVEETLNQMLDAEADQLCNAKRYERTPDRIASRAKATQNQMCATCRTLPQRMIQAAICNIAIKAILPTLSFALGPLLLRPE